MRPSLEILENRNWRLEPTRLANPGKSRGRTGTFPGFARREAAGRDFGRVWNRTESFQLTELGLLARSTDRLLTLNLIYLSREVSELRFFRNDKSGQWKGVISGIVDDTGEVEYSL